MSHTFHTTGVVLHRRDYTEYSHMYTVYTKDYGKISAHCRGSKKLKSKMAPYLESHDVLQLFLVQGRSKMTIIGVEHAQRFPKLLEDYRRVLFVSYCLELIDKLMKNGDRDPEVFDLVNDTLRLLSENEKGYDLIMHGFTLKLLVHIGFTPQLYYCLRCEKDLAPHGNIFSFAEGGVICSQCSGFHTVNGLSIQENTIKLLRVLSTNHLEHILTVGMKNDVRHEFAHIVQKYFLYHTDRKIKSLKLLALV